MKNLQEAKELVLSVYEIIKGSEYYSQVTGEYLFSCGRLNRIQIFTFLSVTLPSGDQVTALQLIETVEPHLKEPKAKESLLKAKNLLQ